ncbi:MAG: hypothetical protein AB8H79_02285 [Myxococcota bacterium]
MRGIVLATALFGLAGCLTDVDIPLDDDGDGLLSNYEIEIGTDPFDPDSDGDGHSDGKEIDKGFDPLNELSYPYTGNYNVDVGCRDEPHEATGNNVGDITGEFAGTDQHGDRFASLDFCGKVILLETGAFW